VSLVADKRKKKVFFQQKAENIYFASFTFPISFLSFLDEQNKHLEHNNVVFPPANVNITHRVFIHAKNTPITRKYIRIQYCKLYTAIKLDCLATDVEIFG
jgi:hypothetical protein